MNCKVCENTSAKNSSVSFFRFPKENSRCRDWAERCNLLNLYEKHGTLRFYKSFRICSDHFDPKDIVFDGRKKRLLQSATPGIFDKTRGTEDTVDELSSFNNDAIFKLKLVENLCRLCAEENRNLTDIFGWRGRTLNLEDKLKYFPVVMTKCDVLPLRVCHQCISKVNQFYDFIMNCMKAETKLRIMLDLEDCDTTYKMIKCDNCKQEADWSLGIKSEETPNLDSKSKMDNSPNLMRNSPETTVKDYSEFHQVLPDLNSSLEHAHMDYFCDNSETNCIETNQSFKMNDTNYVKEVDFSRNISFEHNYSNTPARDQFSSGQKTQTATDQNRSEETKFQCDICLERFTRVEALHAHSGTHALQSDSNREFTCKVCAKVFFSRYDLEDHVSTHAGDFHRCQICDRKFHEVAFLEKHSLVHNVGTSAAAAAADYFADLRPSRDLVDAGEIRLPSFPALGESLPGFRQRRANPKRLKIRLQARSAARRRCKFCDRLFKNRQICLDHEKGHTGDAPYECKLCRKSFRSRQSLRQHRSVHSDKRLFACHECGTSFKRKDTLRNHLRIHTGERPFVCKICGFAFKQRGDCMKHEKNHERTAEGRPASEDVGTQGGDREAKADAAPATKETTADVSQIQEGMFWTEEKSLPLPSFITIAEEMGPVDSLEEIVAGRMISF